MTITLKNVPDEVYRTLKRAAKEQGRSLNAQSSTRSKRRLRYWSGVESCLS
jgi:plasmid stability protein